MGTGDVIYEGHGLITGYRNGHQTTVVHQHLSLALYRGELTCLLGCNGAGKSTLLRTLSGLQPLLGGHLKLYGKPFQEYSERQLAKMIGLVLTERTQTGGLTVYELVALGRQPHTGYFGRLKNDDKERIHNAIASVGLKGKTQNYMAELSDGERQKAMIAKALVQECPVIILDEPTAFLDVVSRIEMMELLHAIAEKEQKAVLLSTHDVEQALALGDRLWVMTQDRKMLDGTVEDIVLSGGMNHLFEHPTIHFDVNVGGYQTRKNCGSDIVLKAADSTLYHWAKNALQRNGFLCHSEEVSPSCPTLQVDSNNKMIWVKDNMVQTFHSFEELLSHIKL